MHGRSTSPSAGSRFRALRLGGAVVFIVSFMTWGIASSAWSLAPRQSLLPNSPVSTSVLVAQAIHSGRLSVHGSGAQSSVRPNVPSAILPNVKASTGSQPVNEDPITADPNNGNHLMSAGNDYNCSSLQGVYNSDDGGATWRQHCVPVVTGSGCGDPNVAYDGNGVAYFLGIDCTSNGSIIIQSSANNGVTWGAAHVAFNSLLGGLTDKEWTEIDANPASPFYNCIYTSWTDFNSAFTQTRASVAHSCDGGNTWTRVAVDSTQTVPKIDQFTDLAIGPTGTVYLTWMNCKSSSTSGNCSGTSVDMKFSKSTDGGNTWTAPVVIATVALTPATGSCYYGCFPGTSERVANIPSVDYDNSTGKLWVAFFNYSGGKSHAELASSSTDGATWTAPVVINPSGNAGWLWCSTNDAGKIAVSFLFSKTNGQYFAGAVTTPDGVTFTKNKLSTGAAMFFSNDGFSGTFIGDYTGSIYTGTTLHVSWMDTRSGGVSADMTGGVS